MLNIHHPSPGTEAKQPPDFTLQQNSDLTTTNWTDVPTPPVLNLTNLQNQVIVSPTNGSTFYRLKR